MTIDLAGTTEVLTVAGDVATRELASAIDAAIERRPETLVLDLSAADSIGADAAAALVGARAHARARSVKLVVLAPATSVRVPARPAAPDTRLRLTGAGGHY